MLNFNQCFRLLLSSWRVSCGGMPQSVCLAVLSVSSAVDKEVTRCGFVRSHLVESLLN